MVLQMHPLPKNWLLLEGVTTSLLVKPTNVGPQILYWGEKLQHFDAEDIEHLLTRKMPHGSADIEVPVSLCPTRGSGFLGLSGIELHQNGKAWDFVPSIRELKNLTVCSAKYMLFDPVSKIGVEHYIEIDPATDVLKFETRVLNQTKVPLTLNWCNAATVPLPNHIDTITGFHGRWVNEFQAHTLKPEVGAYVRENMRGRTSHDSFPGLLLHTSATNEAYGSAYGFHLGWSGNHRLVAERLHDGRSFVQMGERLIAGEVILEPETTYQSPPMFASYSANGFSGLSANFHKFVRSRLTDGRAKNKPRPVHYNTWEAVYFDHDVDKLKTLATEAADVGAERFVLDDGWFKGRRGDNVGLGDWYVDKDIYPNGLKPLIDHVVGLGMEFGLWFEPEMVNQNSDLYRVHPDWVLSAKTAENIPSRNQLVLNLTNVEVFDYLFERLDRLLSEYDISYIKWDMNRDIHHPGADGYAVASLQTKAVYKLLAKLRKHHPQVEIESCSSGGARVDYGILLHTDRVWTSDSNDALDRLAIQRGISFFFPSDVMGAHVGPRRCHTTGRVLSMETRCATAMFGHMGVELDLAELNADERETLKAAIALHKKHRDLIHGGTLIRLDGEGWSSAFGIVAQEKDQALFSYTQTKTRTHALPGVFRFAGLDAEKIYRIEQIWPPMEEATLHFSGREFSGEVLMKIGFQLPNMLPATSLIFYLEG